MLKENVFILAKPHTSCENILTFLSKRFGKLEKYSERESLIRNIEYISNNKLYIDNTLLILIIESPDLQYISRYMETNVSSSNYILVSLCQDKNDSISNCSSIFEHICNCMGSPDLEFFLNKLEAEINNKNRLSFLQSQVAEFYEIGKSLSSEKDTLKLFNIVNIIYS